MNKFKFFKDDIENSYEVTENDILRALELGRQSYLNGDNLEVTPYLTRSLVEAFEEGWELEHSYDLLRQAQQSANNENI